MSVPVACDLTHLTCFLFFFFSRFLLRRYASGPWDWHRILSRYTSVPLRVSVHRASSYRSPISGARLSYSRCHPCSEMHTQTSIHGVCLCVCVQMLVFINVILDIVFLKKTLPHLEYNVIGRLIAWWVVGKNNASPKKRVCSTCRSRNGKRSHERSRAGFAMSCSWMGTLVLPFPAVWPWMYCLTSLPSKEVCKVEMVMPPS